MPAPDKLAVLMPVFNGGPKLLTSLHSCAAAGLPADRYELIVVDNCSTDGAVENLPAADLNGAPVRVFRNSSNLGRVNNWNRAMEIATGLGFRYVTFLFAGDCWLPDSGIGELLQLMQTYHTDIAFAPFVISGEDGEIRRESRRFYTTNTAVCSPAEFLSTLLESGLFPLGPLQANIYRVSAGHRPYFNSAEPTRTDVEATLDFVQQSKGTVLVASRPYLQWREHAGRFHMSMGTGRTIEDYMETFQRACRRVTLPLTRPVDFDRAKSGVVLNSLRLMISDAPVLQWPKLLAVLAHCSFRTPYRVNIFHFFGTLWARFARGRRLLEFS